MQQISRSIYVESEFSGPNVGAIVTGQGIVMVDTPERPEDALAWRAELEKMGPILYLINTEHHPDHVSGNRLFSGTVVGTQETRAALTRPGEADNARRRLLELWPNSAPLLKGFALRPPTIAFSERLSLYPGELTLRLFRTPGHTFSGLAAYCPEEKVVFTGDNVICRLGPGFHDALPQDWFDSLRLIEALDAEVVVPGHGAVCDMGYVRDFTRELEAYIRAVREAVDRGLSEEEAAIQVKLPGGYGRDEATLTDRQKLRRQQGVRRIYQWLTGR